MLRSMNCLKDLPGWEAREPVDPQWSVIHPRPPMGDRIIPEASHLGQPQEAGGSCELTVQLSNLYREAEKRQGLGRATHYRVSFSSKTMGEYQYLRKTDWCLQKRLC